MDLKGRLISDFDYLKKEEEFELPEENEHLEEATDIELSSLGKRVLESVQTKEKNELEKKLAEAVPKKKKKVDLEELISVEEFLEERKEKKDWRHERHHTGKMANSVTSTYVDLETADEKRVMSDMEIMREIWIEIKSIHLKGYIQVQTNLGELNIELFTDQAVRTCFSFLDLIYKKELIGMKFRRLVPGALLSLENSHSKQITLDTVDRSEKLLHKKPGLLTVDTLGGLNTFGFTLGPADLLDRTNSVFGVIIDGLELLEIVELADHTNEVPNKILEITDIKVLKDPYRETCRKYRKKLFGVSEITPAEAKKKTKEEKDSKMISHQTTQKIINM